MSKRSKSGVISDMEAVIPNRVGTGTNLARGVDGKFTSGNKDATMTEAVSSILGNSAIVSRQMGISDLDLREGFSHTTTGIPYAIHGTATLVQQQVAKALAAYQDPIKAILGTAVHRDRKIIIRRKYVVGGKAMITPERAPARTVAIKEDERHVTLARYGGDLEMNLNLFLRPEEAREEFQMKLDAQKAQLEQQLCKLGYDMLLREGTQLTEAMMRAHPGNKDMGPRERQRKADAIYTHTCFGAMNKNNYPIEALMASAKAANLYTPGAPHGYSTMIIPNGMYEMHKYTKPEELVYNLNGVKSPDKKPVTLKFERALKDTRTGMNLLVHTGFADSQYRGTPYAVNGGGGLARKIKILVYYDTQDATAPVRIANVHTGGFEPVEAKKRYLREYTVLASSAIMAVPGSDTGELLYAYPSTGISTSQTTESMKMQLRVYLGSILYDPTKILILPDVFVHAVLGASELLEVNRQGATGQGPMQVGTSSADLYDTYCEEMIGAKTNSGEARVAYCGRVDHTVEGKFVTLHENRGHLGKLDDPDSMTLNGGYAYKRELRP